MERLTHKYTDGQAYVSMNQLKPMMENEVVGLPITKLAHYEDLAEQGILMELPCVMGDKIFVIPSKVNYDLNILNGYKENNRVYEQTVEEIRFYKDGRYLLITCDGLLSVVSDFYKINWFLTRSEAEQALAERQE